MRHKPVGAGRPSADLAFFIGVAFVAKYTSNTMVDTGRVVLVSAPTGKLNNPVNFR